MNPLQNETATVTAKDIARELDLSQSTVSRILNSDESHRASEATRQRVFETAQRMGYQTNAIARSLRRGRTDIIGVHTNYNYDVRNDFFGTLVGALQCACSAYHLDLLVNNTRHGASTDAIFAKLRDGRIDGLILHASANDPLLKLVARSSLPLVVVADQLPGLPCVTCEDASGMGQLIAKLGEKGHRNFVFLAPFQPPASVQERQDTFSQELEKRGVRPEQRRIKTISYEQASAVLSELLEGEPVAVCCWNDRAAYNLLRECGLRGVAVPEQLAVTGFDGFLDEKPPARQLVTAHCPWEDVAAKAIDVLVQLIQNRGDADRSLRDQFAALTLPGIATIISAPEAHAAPVVTQLVQTAGRWQLVRDGQPYLVKGAGGGGSLQLLRDRGGNSNRTWGADNINQKFDDAARLGMTYTVGIWLEHTEQGFNYSDEKAVAAQFEKAKFAIDRYKDHPAVLAWGIGNEMEGFKRDTDPKMWAAVEQIAAYAKRVDPNHRTMTVVAEIGGDKVAKINELCPDIDIVGINSYGGAPSIPARYAKAGGVKPYIVTEFGPPGT